MRPEEYETLFRLEDSYWWFRALRGVVADTCRRLGLTPSSRVLDAGCGTGGTLQRLGGELGGHWFGFDVSPEASGYWVRRGLTRLSVGSINAIPFRDGSFDAALCLDVLECEGVDETRACGELLRVVRRDGYVLLLVPAYEWLASREHDRAVGACRRYSRERLRGLLEGQPVRVHRLTHLFGSTLPCLAAYRFWRRWRGSDGGVEPRSEVRALAPALDEALFRAVNWERALLSRWELPFGSSILAVIQKGSG